MEKDPQDFSYQNSSFPRKIRICIFCLTSRSILRALHKDKNHHGFNRALEKYADIVPVCFYPPGVLLEKVMEWSLQKMPL